MSRNLTKEEIVAKADAASKAAYESNKQDRAAYRAAEYGVRDQFRSDLEAMHGFDGDSSTPFQTKLDLLWDYSWREGHSAGYYEVANIYDELAPLLEGTLGHV